MMVSHDERLSTRFDQKRSFAELVGS
jgi:hypothetical protein